MTRALLAVLLAACSTSSSPPRPPAQLREQLITGIVDDWSSTHATLRLWSRTGAGPWQPVGDPWPAVIGRSGAALVEAKHEGDGKSPAGRFELRGAYGYASAPPDGTRLPYTQSDRLECVDDPASKVYTQIVDGTSATRDWKSSEQMRRSDVLYTWVIDIAHNTTAQPGGGSCIFFHVWSGPDSTTAGCTAMPEDKLVGLLRTLDPAAHPRYVLLPRAEYQARQVAWDLPAQ